MISLYFQYAAVLVGFVSFTLSSLEPALHLPSVVDVLLENNVSGSPGARKFDGALVHANFFSIVARGASVQGP